MLRGPHLVLADFGRDDRCLFVGRFPQLADGFLRHDLRLGCGVGERLFRAPALDPGPPRREISLLVLAALPDLDHILDHAADIANDPNIDGHDLVD